MIFQIFVTLTLLSALSNCTPVDDHLGLKPPAARAPSTTRATPVYQQYPTHTKRQIDVSTYDDDSDDYSSSEEHSKEYHEDKRLSRDTQHSAATAQQTKISQPTLFQTPTPQAKEQPISSLPARQYRDISQSGVTPPRVYQAQQTTSTTTPASTGFKLFS